MHPPPLFRMLEVWLDRCSLLVKAYQWAPLSATLNNNRQANNLRA